MPRAALVATAVITLTDGHPRVQGWGQSRRAGVLLHVTF